MEPQVGQVLEPDYGMLMVSFSFMVAVAGSFVALMCAQRMFNSEGRAVWPMILGGGVALGGIAIWAMHFIGMLAYRLPVPVSYAAGPTLLSFLVASGMSALALYLTGRGVNRFSVPGWLAGTALAAAGVIAMHYMGMDAMRLRAVMTFEPGLVIASVLIAVVAAAAALWIAFHIRSLPLMGAAAILMGVAVCAVHYVGMMAANFVCSDAVEATDWRINGDSLGLAAFFCAGVLLIAIAWFASGRAAHAVTPASWAGLD